MWRLLSLVTAVVAVVAQVQCPDGYTAPTTYTGFCYKFNHGTMTWNAHENACSQVTLNGAPYAGGHLATIFDQPSASVVMNQYCNNLNQGHSYYFIGYYCVSSSYTYRPDWRWTSGKPTTWLHGAPAYLSGAEPDDFGCGLAHYSDDGVNTGRVGDWSCSRALKGGCCEAPVVPTPSPSTTATQTATRTSTQTSTKTATASNTQTGTQTASPTYTSTNTKSSTETRSSTQTATSTRTATRTATPSASPSESVSSSESVSPSASPSESVTASVTASVSPSESASQTVSITVSVSLTPSRTPTPPPLRLAGLGALGEGSSVGMGAGMHWQR